MGNSETNKVLKQISSNTKYEPKAEIATGMFLPNHSGVSDKQIKRNNEIRHTKWFGSIQAAIDDLPSTGGTVFIDAGTYYISSSINVNKANVTLEGEGSLSLIYLNNSVDANCIYITEDNVTIRNIKVDGNGSNQGSGVGVYAYLCDYFFIENCEIYNTKVEGIKLATSNYSNISNNYIHNIGGHGIRLEKSSYNNIANNRIDTIGTIGIGIGSYAAAAYSLHNVVTGNVVTNTTNNALDCNGGSYNIYVGNNLKSCYDGICFDSANTGIISNNIIESSTNVGINLGNTAGGNANNCLIIGNRVSNQTGSNSFRIEANECFITGNYVYNQGSGVAGYLIVAGGTDNVIINNYGTPFTDLGTNTIKGSTGTFTTADAKTVTVTDGIITSIV